MKKATIYILSLFVLLIVGGTVISCSVGHRPQPPVADVVPVSPEADSMGRAAADILARLNAKAPTELIFSEEDEEIPVADAPARPIIVPDTAAPAHLPVIAPPVESVPADSIGIDSISADSVSADSTKTDSTKTDSTKTDSIAKAPARGPINIDSIGPRRSRIRLEKVDLDASVVFSASDSMIIIRQDSAMMYGDSQVSYGEIKLNAGHIEMDLNDNTVYAVGAEDSLGVVQGKPVFTESGTDYEANTMRYNFKSKKGFITDVVTQQGEGFLTGGETKKDDHDNYYVRMGRYTTCDNHDCPHFYFQLTKAKMRPGKDIVMGPAYMVLAGLPLPIAVPFGFFPFTEDYSSGVIIPTFGDDYQRGFYLSDGGYYFAISDNMDLALTGELYTKGSWGLRAQSSYTKRYKYNGSFNISYLKTITGEKGSPDYATSTNFQVLWNHSQDAKANPNMSLSASVNFTTSGYSRNDLTSYYSNSFTENTKSSTVNLTYRFPQSKWSLSTTMNISQRTQDSTLAVSFPNFTLTMSQIYPFKRKKAVGDERWYEKIRISYNGQFQNSLTSKQDEFFKKSLIKDWRNGMRHSIPVSATFNLFKYINVTPSLNFTDRMYTRKVRQHWDEVTGIAVMDTTYSFYNVWDFNAAVSLDTKIFGFFQPLGFLGKKVKMIRHVLTPTISFSASPDFSSPFFGYYGSYQRPGQAQPTKYSLFPNALYGVPGQGKTGALSVSLSNNVEMKMHSDNDSIGDKKISLIENLSISQSYNFAADSLRFSDLNTSILLRLTKGFNLNLGATWDVYTYALNEYGNPVRVNKLRIANGKGFGRLRSTGTSFSYTINNDTFKKLFGKGDSDTKSKDKGNMQSENEGNDGQAASPRRDRNSRNRQDKPDVVSNEGYIEWSIPWNLTFNYSVSYGYGAFNKQKMEYDTRITQNLSFSGSIRPTKTWNISFSSSYNFDTKRIAYMNCNLSRDLHCFTMTASFVPLGPYKSYNFHIAVKSSLLSDFKYDKRSSISNGIQWY